MEAGAWSERVFFAGEGAAGGFLALAGPCASLPLFAGLGLGGVAGALEPIDLEALESSMSGPYHVSLWASSL